MMTEGRDFVSDSEVKKDVTFGHVDPENRKEISDYYGFEVVNKFSKVAEETTFDKMIDYIEHERKANGIICWKPNRLSRNPVDGGKVQWLLQNEIIQSILTPHREYLPEDNSLILGFEVGISTQFSRDLAKDVKRGLTTKVEKGWRPGLAPVGYLNEKFQEKGNKTTGKFFVVHLITSNST